MLLAKNLKYEVVFDRYHTKAWWLGVHQGYNQKLVVRVLEGEQQRSLVDIAFILAHEIRHAQHLRDDLFHGRSLEAQPDLDDNSRAYYADIAYQAELDCDDYAREYIDKFFPNDYSELRNRIYPKWKIDKRLLSGHDLEMRVIMELMTHRFKEVK